jgi:hypothetical protein
MAESSLTLLVQTRQLGSRRRLLEDWGCELPPAAPGDGGDGGFTLRELIALVVRREVAAFRERQERARLPQILTAREIDAQSAAGRVRPGERDFWQSVDEEQAVAVALQAFEDGLYLVILDGQEKRHLDETVFVHDRSTLVFLRLTLLAGA